MCRGFVTGTGYQLLDNDELSLGHGSDAQVFQYGETIVVSPVVEYSADQEDRDIVFLRRLWVKEAVAFVMKGQCATAARCRWKLTNFGALRGQTRVRLAYSFPRTVAQIS